MSQVNEERPQFAVAIRGYDRLQVDEYIDRLTEVVAEADHRAREAEADLEYSRHMNVGPRVAQIFELAVDEVRDLREQAAQAVEQLRTDAEIEAEEIIAHAREDAAEVEAQIEADRARARVELAEIEAHKEGSVRELRRLQQALAAAAGLVTLESAPTGEDEPADADVAEVREDNKKEPGTRSGRARKAA